VWKTVKKNPTGTAQGVILGLHVVLRATLE
jgi:hypothetical protein